MTSSSDELILFLLLGIFCFCLLCILYYYLLCWRNNAVVEIHDGLNQTIQIDIVPESITSRISLSENNI